MNENFKDIEGWSTFAEITVKGSWGLKGFNRLIYKILVERPLVLILVVVANIQMMKYLKISLKTEEKKGSMWI